MIVAIAGKSARGADFFYGYDLYTTVLVDLERVHKKGDRRWFPSIDLGSNARPIKNLGCVFNPTKSKRSLG